MPETVTLFARHPGQQVDISGFGRATYTEGLCVPAAVAATLTEVPSLRVDDGTEVPVETRTFPTPASTIGVTVAPGRAGRVRANDEG